jgi:ABC-type multidrug transport system fused ATPase/permease subunit
MESKAPPFKIVRDEDSVDLRAHYEAVAQHALRILWQRKWLIAATAVASLVIAVIALMQMGPRYTSEALIQASLTLNPDTSTKSQSVVSVNAAEVADSTARVIRSRTTADAVVAQLGLDKDPRFERQPPLSRWLSAVRSALGLQQTTLTPRDLAVDALMRQVRVTAEPRSYLISVTVTAGEPEIAAKLANAVAVEYLRRQTLKELAEARSAVEHDLTDASLVYGPRHPTYLRASTKLEQLDARVAALRDASSTEDLIKLATGHSLIAAHMVMKPSGPDIPLILTLAILGGLSLGISLARYTPIGFVRPALAAGVQNLLFAAYALVDGIFAIVTARRAMRRWALLVRLLEAIRRRARRVGELVAFNILASRVSAPVMRIAQIWQDFPQARLSVLRLGNMLKTPTEPAHWPTRLALPDVRGDITFEHVTFRYRIDGPEVLHDVSFHVPAGQVVGIVGPSGSGKSTLAKLIQRLCVPDSGRVLVDGVDLAMVDTAWLRRQIGIVLQENVLSNRTVRENIALADPDMPTQRVIAAADLAGAHDFILELPEGYDTIVGERGAALSGEQRQRIAIARTLVTNPRILILDEATSALDYESERIIQHNVERITRNRSVIVIAHRLSTVQRCRRILILDHGRLIEDGSYDELIHASGPLFFAPPRAIGGS